MPAGRRPYRRAASTLLVAVNPTIAEQRATASAASSPWVRRSAKSTTSRPAAARTHRAALEAIVVWNVIWLSRYGSTSCATAIGAVISSSGSFAYTTRPSGTAQTSPVEPERPERVEHRVLEPELATEVVELLLRQPEPLEEVQARLEPGGHEEAAGRRELADEQAERRLAAHPALEVAGGHVELVQVGQQPARRHGRRLPERVVDAGRRAWRGGSPGARSRPQGRRSPAGRAVRPGGEVAG